MATLILEEKKKHDTSEYVIFLDAQFSFDINVYF